MNCKHFENFESHSFIILFICKYIVKFFIYFILIYKLANLVYIFIFFFLEGLQSRLRHICYNFLLFITKNCNFCWLIKMMIILMTCTVVDLDHICPQLFSTKKPKMRFFNNVEKNRFSSTYSTTGIKSGQYTIEKSR